MKPLLAAAFLMCALAGCQSPPRVATEEEAVTNELLVGEWTGPRGQRVLVEDRRGRRYRVTVIPADGEQRTLDARLTEISGRQFIEISVNDPGGSELPAYHYGLIEVAGHSFSHRALDPAWLEQYSTGPGAGRTFITSTESGHPVVGCATPEDMRAMLAAALDDPAALRPAESFTRIN
jgi:hypothetical protein